MTGPPMPDAIGSTTPALDKFRSSYKLRNPEKPDNHPHESKKIESKDGLAFLRPAPASGVKFGNPQKPEDPARNTYLWIIDDRGIPYLIDCRMAILYCHRPKHTNLTGGRSAYIGGELWFSDPNSIYVSGSSGRFHPSDEQQLDAAIGVFSSFKYIVTSLGWNQEAGHARRILES